MTLRQLPSIALALAGLAVVIVLLAAGGSGYRVTVQLANASGLESGSQVKIGGVPVGSVTGLQLGRGDVVEADLTLDSGHAVSAHASAQIVPEDLLGSMFLELHPGTGERLPSGATIPSTRVSYPVQLDQVLGVLDANTRAKLAIVIDEAGTALTGRRADFNRLLSLLPSTFGSGAALLTQLNSDNQSLRSLITRSDEFMQALTPQDRSLSSLIATAGQTMHTTATQQANLQLTLQRAPATLTAARQFLGQLQQTAEPLGPAAGAIAQTAPRLTAALDQIPAFQQAASPTLQRATRVAPLLTELAVGATPVIAAAEPTARSLATLAQGSGPLTYAAGASIDNLLGLIEGWARSIEGRDGISHVFHGRALIGPELIKSLVNSLSAGTTPSQRTHRPTAGVNPAPIATSGSTLTPAAPASTKPALPIPPVLGGIVAGVQHTLGQVLGGLHKSSGNSSGSGQPNSGANPTSLGHLLNYLLGP